MILSRFQGTYTIHLSKVLKYYVTDDYTEDSRPETVQLLCSFYRDALWPIPICLVSYAAIINKLAPNDFTESLFVILNQYNLK